MFGSSRLAEGRKAAEEIEVSFTIRESEYFYLIYPILLPVICSELYCNSCRML